MTESDIDFDQNDHDHFDQRRVCLRSAIDASIIALTKSQTWPNGDALPKNTGTGTCFTRWGFLYENLEDKQKSTIFADRKNKRYDNGKQLYRQDRVDAHLRDGVRTTLRANAQTGVQLPEPLRRYQVRRRSLWLLPHAVVPVDGQRHGWVLP